MWAVERARGGSNESAIAVRAAGSGAIHGVGLVDGFDWIGARRCTFYGVVDGLGCGNATEQLLGTKQARVDVARCEQTVVADLEELMR